MNKLAWVAALGMLLWLPSQAAAIDPWDVTSAFGDDDTTSTDNELASGTVQQHDLQAVSGVQDQDWYLVGQQPYSSYEVIADSLTEDVADIPATNLNQALQVDLVDGAGTLQSSGYAFSSLGSARSLRFRNATSSEITNQYVRIMTGSAGNCTTTCTSTSQYRVAMKETTLLAPRFNNTGTQSTIVFLQNGGRESLTASIRFYNTAGALVGTHTVNVPVKGLEVVPTFNVPGVGGQSGSMSIDHTGRFGGLSAKAVALEPSTGFTFDTAFVPKFQ